jgi:hypothetical protein
MVPSVAVFAKWIEEENPIRPTQRRSRQLAGTITSLTIALFIVQPVQWFLLATTIEVLVDG